MGGKCPLEAGPACFGVQGEQTVGPNRFDFGLVQATPRDNPAIVVDLIHARVASMIRARPVYENRRSHASSTHCGEAVTSLSTTRLMSGSQIAAVSSGPQV